MKKEVKWKVRVKVKINDIKITFENESKVKEMHKNL